MDRLNGIEKMAQNDIGELISLSKAVGWDYDQAGIETIMASGTIFGYRNKEGKLAACAALIPYRNQLASIGIVIVHPESRGLGLGRSVTQRCIDSMNGNASIMLIATPDGKPMYEKMGFKAVDCVHKLICDDYRPAENLPNYSIRPFQEEDFRVLVELDRDATGADRETFLKARIRQAKECVVMMEKEDKICGFGLSITGPANMTLGPIVAGNDSVACSLVQRLATGHTGKLRIDVSSGKEEFLSFLKERGFQQVSQPPIMMLGNETMPTRNGALFAIAAQSFG